MQGRFRRFQLARHRASSSLCVSALSLFVAVNACAVDRLQISAAPVFLGGNASNGLAIDLENSGPDARGVVRINSSQGITVYPVELPRGSHKRFVGFPIQASFIGYDPISCDLDTNQGGGHYDLPYTGIDANVGPLEITDEMGGLQFVKPSTSSRTPSYVTSREQATYVKPEEAPGRLLAYRNLPAVVLGSGSERITDDAVHALTEYVVGGGRLIFVGGAVAPSMHDPRWNGIFPLSNPHAETAEVVLHVGAFGFRQSLSVQTGGHTDDCLVQQGGVILRPIGVGEVIVIPFDILEGPLKSWDGRDAFFKTLTNSDTALSLAFPSLIPQYDSYSGYSSPSYSSPGGPSPYSTSSPTEDPFSFQPPQPEVVATWIVCYLILVAPLNFMVLRKLKKSEWAWFTTPCISIVFAGFILTLASGLYFGKMSTAVHGRLLVTEGSPVGLFRGSSQLFFPSGGTYNLQLSGVDWMSATESMGYRVRGSGQDLLTVVDSGHQMEVPSLSVRNLQFRDFDFEQVVDTRGWFVFTVIQKPTEILVTVTNRSTFEFAGGFLAVEGSIAPVIVLEPGKSTTLKLPLTKATDGGSQDWTQYSREIHHPILNGTLVGFRPGPQTGAPVAIRSNVQVTVIGAASTMSGGSN